MVKQNLIDLSYALNRTNKYCILHIIAAGVAYSWYESDQYRNWEESWGSGDEAVFNRS